MSTQAITTAQDCRKLADFYRNRKPGQPMSEQERIGLANLLIGVADLIESSSRFSYTPKNNVVQLNVVRVTEVAS